jgi:hypothetical protein
MHATPVGRRWTRFIHVLRSDPQVKIEWLDAHKTPLSYQELILPSSNLADIGRALRENVQDIPIDPLGRNTTKFLRVSQHGVNAYRFNQVNAVGKILKAYGFILHRDDLYTFSVMLEIAGTDGMLSRQAVIAEHGADATMGGAAYYGATQE